MKAISGDCLANSAIRFCFVDTVFEFRCIRCVSQIRFHDSVPRFPPPDSAGCRSPSSTVLSRHYDFLSLTPRHFVAFVWRYHKFALVRSLSHDKCHHVSPELVTRYLPPGTNCGNDRRSQVPGRPQYPFARAPRLRQVD